MRGYEVIIVGAGPAGIFTALELGKNGATDVLILDKGPDIEQRKCPARRPGGQCIHCQPCRILAGWGGAGAFSDGKLTLSPLVGGRLADILGQERARALIDEVDATFVRFGASGPVYTSDGDALEELGRRATLAGLRLVSYPIRHMGTERCGAVLRAMRDELLERGVDIQLHTEVTSILVEDGHSVGVETSEGERIEARHIVVAPGREGADWLKEVAQELRLSLERNPVDLGVRVEVPAEVLAPLTNLIYEPKLYYYSRSFDDRLRTFCVCPHGEVVVEYAGDVMTVNGHSYADRESPNTNFAILVSKTFTEPFREPIAYGKYIARLANLLSDGIIVQRLGDLRRGRRSTPKRLARSIVTPTLKEATPGDLGLVLPYRYWVNILEMLDAMDELAPGVASNQTLLYGVEVKFYSSRLELTEDLETQVENLFAAGDGAGVTRGLVQAAASGLVVARAILRLHRS
ncbi:MAG: FAD-dependent oxidoreductase [Chloroflexota bacterium]|nr:FAD-dependent oxidoreductase [Chloroflexota bacterium]